MAWGVFCAKHGRLLSSGAREGGIRDGVVSRVPGAVFPLAAAADGERRRVVVENNERGYATAQENVHFQRVCTDWEHGSLFVAESGEEKIKRVSSRRRRVFLYPAVENGAVEWRRGDFFGRV